MTTQELLRDEKHLLNVMSTQRFLKMEGLSNEIPFFIYPFHPSDAIEVNAARKRITNNLALKGIKVLEIDLFELSIEILGERGILDRLLESEPAQEKVDFLALLQGMLDPERHIAPAVANKLLGSDHDVMFLTGVGKVFPYVRSHNVLSNLQSICKGKPMLTFFPGTYEQSESMGSSLALFGFLKNDQYYRAKNILEQEA